MKKPLTKATGLHSFHGLHRSLHGLHRGLAIGDRNSLKPKGNDYWTAWAWYSIQPVRDSHEVTLNSLWRWEFRWADQSPLGRTPDP